MKICHLMTHGILEVSGEESKSFLQDLITVDMNKLDGKNALWGGLLTPQGKYLYDFIIYEKDNDQYFLDCFSGRIEELEADLKTYRLRKNIKIQIRREYAVAAAFLPAHDANAEKLPGLSVTDKLMIVSDPRTPEMGLRIVTLKEDMQNFLNNYADCVGTEQDFFTHRIRCGVPELAVDLISRDIFWPETGAERLNGIDYQKGCFVGQEVTSALKRKTELKKQIIPVRLVGNPLAPCGLASDMIQVGDLLCAAAGYGLAFVRLERWENAIRTLRTVTAGDCPVLKAA